MTLFVAAVVALLLTPAAGHVFAAAPVHGSGTAPHESDLARVNAASIVRAPVAGATLTLNTSVAEDGDFVLISGAWRCRM